MADTPTRLLVAYGLIALMILGAAALVWWRGRNTQRQREARAKGRLADRYRQRSEAASAAERSFRTPEQ